MLGGTAACASRKCEPLCPRHDSCGPDHRLATAQLRNRKAFRSATNEERSVFVSRLQALGNAHDVLSKQSWEGACLNDVVTKTMEPHRTGQGRIHVSGPDIAIDSGLAIAVALVLHELTRNATKYGALSGFAGKVNIEWETVGGTADDLVCLRWQERDGPPVEKPIRQGFGTLLIERELAAEFRAVAFDFLPDGVACTMEFSRTAAKDNLG